jgi:hypothetical protein
MRQLILHPYRDYRGLSKKEDLLLAAFNDETYSHNGTIPQALPSMAGLQPFLPFIP